jgi:hypothetical protein
LRSAVTRERLAQRGRTDGQVAQPNPHGSEDRIADGGSDNGGRRLAEADWNLRAVDEFDVELRHFADAQRRGAVEIRVADLAFDEIGPFMLSRAHIVGIDIGAARPVVPAIVVPRVNISLSIAATALNVCDPLLLLARGGRPLRRRRLRRVR